MCEAIRTRRITPIAPASLIEAIVPAAEQLAWATALAGQMLAADRHALAEIKAALREYQAQTHLIPLHRQVIPWAARQNVNVVHRADNWLEWRWVSIGSRQ